MFRFVLLVVLFVGFLSCNEESKGTRLNIDTPPNDTIPVKSTVREDSLDGRPITFYLQHPGIPKIAKDMYAKYIEPNTNELAFNLVDSLLSETKETKAFYFLVITRQMKEADGAYAEILGVRIREFAETRTTEFLNYFINEPLLTEEHFNLWARNVAWEIMIEAEGREKAELKTLERKMKANCKNCTRIQSEKLNDFLKLVRLNF